MQEFYYELYLKVNDFKDLYIDFLNDTVDIGYEETDDGFILRSEDSLETIKWGIEQFSEALSKATSKNIDIDIEIEKKENKDWIKEYQTNIQPIEVGEFYIHPTWQSPKEAYTNIVINPSLAFGTGEHPTTFSCLKAISEHIKNDQKVLDIGCGSGILSIAATKKGAIVDACDTDKGSIDNTKENLKLNNVKLHRLWQGSVQDSKERYDVVIANIVADVLIFLSNDIKKVLNGDALLILSGILQKYQDKVMQKYSDLKLLEVIKKDEWVTLIYKNRMGNE